VVLDMALEPRPELSEEPVRNLLWEVAWYAHADDCLRKDQEERVARVLDFLRWLARDPAVARAWARCAAGVSRLLTLAVAHFPVHVGEDGVLETFDWTHFMDDADKDDRPVRLQRASAKG